MGLSGAVGGGFPGASPCVTNTEALMIACTILEQNPKTVF